MSKRSLENYTVICLIGKGAYGEVFKARKRQTGQYVAIKFIKKKGKEEKDIKAMREEIAILKKLKHPNIVVLLDYFENSAEFIIVTELGQGELFNIIEDDQYLEEPEIRQVARQLIRALEYLHQNRITHRDLKPQNILMTSDGSIKLCDFGFARSMSHKTEVLTSLKGTPLYMAPEVVQEHPYTHTADLWSLGVILFELATGTPPFSGTTLFKLIEHITNDPIRFPDSIKGDFHNLLKGLLNKDPNNRLDWPHLNNHPFIRETEQEKQERIKEVGKFSIWIEEQHHSSKGIENLNIGNMKSFSGQFDERSRDISPNKANSFAVTKSQISSDSVWSKYTKISLDEKGASALRKDVEFLNDLLSVLSGNPSEIIRNREQKSILHCSLKVFIQVLLKSKVPENTGQDISKKLNTPNYLLNLLKSMLKLDHGKNYIEIIADIVKLIGLLEKITFDKNFGIEMVYIRSFIPLFPLLLTCASSSNDIEYETLTMNLLRTIGIFANNASTHFLKSFSFYKDIMDVKFIPDFISIFKTQPSAKVHKLLVQVISAFMHPVYGDIEFFPWKRANINGIKEYNEYSTMIDCIKQSIINNLLSMDWMTYFEAILELEDNPANILPKISITRTILQSLRLSKEFEDELLARPNAILKFIFETLNSSEAIIYGTSCLIISHLLKSIKEKKKSQHFLEQNYLSELTISTLINKMLQENLKNYSLFIFGSFIIFQELMENSSVKTNKLVDFMISDKCLKTISNFVSSNDSRLEEMRNIEGSNYGIHLIGQLDPVFLTYHKLFVSIVFIESKLRKEDSETMGSLSQAFTSSQLSKRISEIIVKVSSKTDLSPKGMIALLMVIFDLSSIKLLPEFKDSNFIKNLVLLISDSQISNLSEWPQNFGGGESCSQIVLGNLMNIFLLYFQEAEKEPEIIKTIFQSNLIKEILHFFKHLGKETVTPVIIFIANILSLSSERINFVKQFLELGGMNIFTHLNLLSEKAFDSVTIIEACNLLSEIARSSKETYEHIDSINPYSDLKLLLKNSDNTVQARTLYLLGNMCRHSSYFYPKFAEFEFVKDIVHLCSSEDKSIKKYACIALGNAGFHGSQLYSQLKESMTALVLLLKDLDEKTRSNAAAALGNLARNSEELDLEFVRTGAVLQLVNMIINDKSLPAKRVSIMAITNLLGLKESSKLLKSLNLSSILTKFVPPAFNSDPNVIKAAQKALDKLA